MWHLLWDLPLALLTVWRCHQQPGVICVLAQWVRIIIKTLFSLRAVEAEEVVTFPHLGLINMQMSFR